MILKKIYLFSLLYFFALCSCVDIIEFPRPASYDNAIAIQGKLIKGEPSTVEVSVSDAFNINNASFFVSAKQVSILDEENHELVLESRQTGIYKLTIPNDHSFFKVEYGKRYKIRLTTVDGEQFESDFDQLYPGVQPDSAMVERVTVEANRRGESIIEKTSLAFSVTTSTRPIGSNDNARLLWEISSTYKITDTPEFYSYFACCGIALDSQVIPFCKNVINWLSEKLNVI